MHLTKRLRVYSLAPDRYLVCNALTGEVSLIGGTVYRQLAALKAGRVDECSSATLRALAERKLAFPSAADEDAAFRSLVQRGLSDYRRRARTEYCFAVNTHCNFNCVYCFEPEALRAVAATLTEQQLDAAFRLVDASAAAAESAESAASQPGQPVPIFTLYGGEPLLVSAKPTVISLLRRIGERGHRASIITNGHTLASFFDVFDAFPGVVESIQLTLDGTELDHNQRRMLRSGAGTFSKIVANIDAFLSRDDRTRCVIRTSFDRANLDRISALQRFVGERGWSGHPRVSVLAVTIQDHRPGESIPGLLGHRDLLEAVFPHSTDSGGGPFDLSSVHVLGHLRNFLGLVAHGRAPAAFAPRVTFCGGTGSRLLVFHPDGHIYPCYEATGQPGIAIGRYYPDLRWDPDLAAQWSEVRLLREPECFDCSISTFCGGGCASGALAKRGRISAAFCEGAHEAFDRYFELIEQEYRQRLGGEVTGDRETATATATVRAGPVDSRHLEIR